GRPTSKLGSLVFGMAFGAGWTPCIGPILGTILFLAGSQGSVLKGTSLLFIYSLGLGVPFLLTGFFLTPALRQMARLKRHLGTIKVVSGLFLVFVGLLILLGELKGFNAFAFSLAGRLEGWAEGSPFAARALPAAILLGISAWIGISYVRRVREPSTSSGKRLYPVRVGFIALFVILAGLSFAGVLQLPHLIAVWLNFQGI
ncbi:MAG TPA: cytochrome c biogenesis protein CcdA, partial [Spirochaetia bacterium]|nr:cytochrome c biogenesis protein CcdA [Spirochaetia bacterium]